MVSLSWRGFRRIRDIGKNIGSIANSYVAILVCNEDMPAFVFEYGSYEFLSVVVVFRWLYFLACEKNPVESLVGVNPISSLLVMIQYPKLNALVFGQ